MALKVYLDDGCKAERSRVISLLRRKRQGWSQSRSLGNSPLWDFIEFLQTGWWWAWRCSMHQVTHEFCELEDGVCPTASTDCQNKGDSTSHQKQCGILLCTRKKKNNTKDGNSEYAETRMFCKLDFSLFLPHPNSDKINPVVSNVLIFVSRTHSNRIWSCQNIPKKISCWVWSLLHSCESETGRRNLLQICNFLATVRMQILLL